MKTMKALRFEAYGPPSVLSLQEVSGPNLESGQALVEVRASAVNPSDVKNVAGVSRRACRAFRGATTRGWSLPVRVGRARRSGEAALGSA